MKGFMSLGLRGPGLLAGSASWRPPQSTRRTRANASGPRRQRLEVHQRQSAEPAGQQPGRLPLDLFAPCPQLRQAWQTIAIRTQPASTRSATGVDVDVLVRSSAPASGATLGGKISYRPTEQVKAIRN